MRAKLLSLLLPLLTSSSIFAGGLILYELGTPDVGLASAGWAARASDAGTVFTNPAGMTRFCERQLLIGVQPLDLNIKFNPNSKTSVKGSHGNSSEWIPTGGSFCVLPITDRISVGGAAVGYFGSKLDYGHHWVGRYYLTRIACQGFSFVPGAAYKVTDSLSIGVCANVMYAIERVHAAVNNALDGTKDGRMRFIGDNWAVGAIVGLLYEPSTSWRCGVTYVSEVRQRFNIKPTFLDAGPKLTNALDALGITNSTVNIACNVPNWIMASIYKKISPSCAIMGNVGWQQWSRFARADLELQSDTAPSISVRPKYKDVWHAALGVEYNFSCSTATCGVAYDSTMISNKNRTPSTPIGKQWRIGLGYIYPYSRCLKLAAAYELNWSGDLKMFQNRGPLAGTIAGKYNNVFGQFFNVSCIWDF